jgi:hypothetical protein
VVSSTEPRVEHFHREERGWKIHDLRRHRTLGLKGFGLTIDIAELYAGVLTLAEAKAGGPAGRSGASWLRSNARIWRQAGSIPLSARAGWVLRRG